MSTTDCLVCCTEITAFMESAAHGVTVNGREHHVHGGCWTRNGLGDTRLDLGRVVAFYRARQQDTFWEAAAVLDEAFRGEPRTPSGEMAVARLAHEFDAPALDEEWADE